MILDALLVFSNAQTFTTGSENGVQSTSSIDLSSVRDPGAGTPTYIVITVATTQVATSADVTYVDLITDDNEGLNSPAVVRRLCELPANSVAGTQIIVALPIEGSVAYQRYIGLKYTSFDHAQTAGAISAHLVLNPSKIKHYPNAFDIATS